MAVTQKPVALTRLDSSQVSIYPSSNGSLVALFSARAPGKQTVNEDALAIIPVNEQSVVLAIADGVGGAPNGDTAAKIAMQSLVHKIGKGNSGPLRSSILDGIELANETIRSEISGAATTLVAVEITNQIARIYHVGDSGACIVGGRGKIKSHTVFHSPTGYALESGLISEHQAIQHEDRYLVSNLLGAEDMSIEIGSPIPLAPRDTIVLASDGLFDNLYFQEIGSAACRDTASQACENLVQLATDRMVSAQDDMPSKPDDLTVVLYRSGRK